MFDPGAPAKPQVSGTNGFAITSLILGIIGCTGIGVVLSIVFGIMALVQLKKRVQSGKALAITGLVLSGVWIIVFAIIVVGGVVTAITNAQASTAAQPHVSTGAQPPPSTAGGDLVTLARLNVGDCVAEVTEGKQVARLLVVACTSTHEAEVVARFDLPAGTYPGEAAVDEQAGNGCADRLEAYSPGSSTNSKIDLFYFAPAEADWTRDHDRNVICMAVQNPPTTTPLKR